MGLPDDAPTAASKQKAAVKEPFNATIRVNAASPFGVLGRETGTPGEREISSAAQAAALKNSGHAAGGRGIEQVISLRRILGLELNPSLRRISFPCSQSVRL